MARKKDYIVVKQVMHGFQFHDNCSTEYLQCFVERKEAAALAREVAEIETKIKKALAEKKDLEERANKTDIDTLKNRLLSRARRAGRRADYLREFHPREYVMRYRKVEKAEAYKLIDDASLEIAVQCPDGIIWDTPDKAFLTRYQRNVTIHDTLGV